MKIPSMIIKDITQQIDTKNTKKSGIKKSANLPSSHSKMSSTLSSGSENVNLSSKGELLNKVINASFTSEARTQKIARLKYKVKNNTYEINSDQIADKLLSEAILDKSASSRAIFK